MFDSTSNQNQNYQQDSGKGSTFGRNLMSYVKSKIPNASIVDPENNEKNPKYKLFHKAGTRRAELLAKHSVSSNNEYNSTPVGAIGKDTSFGDMMYANVQQNKGGRLRDYRVMAGYSEVSDALDELCDETINTDMDGNETKLVLKPSAELTSSVKEEITEQYTRYIEHFDLKNKGWQYFRQLLIEGELYFEQIIHKDHADKGVVGIINLPAEVMDPVFQNIQNQLVKGFIYRKPVFNKHNPTKIEGTELIPMDINQVVYVTSGVLSDNKMMVIPFLENARRPHRQLSLIEDSIVIYRLVRAPSRLVFNVDTGNMPPPRSEAYLKKLISEYWSSKTFDLDQTDVVKRYNPQSMMDNFWFAKRQGSEGTSVTQLSEGCLAMDTLVPLLDGRVLSIKEIADEMATSEQTIWVYSTDPNTGHIAPGLVTWAGVTHKSAKVMRLTFDTGKSVVCTLDHKFPVLGKGFVEAKDLQLNESMVPRYTKLNKIGNAAYEMVYQNDEKKWEYTHRMVASFFRKRSEHNEWVYNDEHKDKPRTTVHHKNHKKLDNHPDNLIFMNNRDHMNYHKDCYGIPPMVGTIAAAKKLQQMKIEEPEKYAARSEMIRERTAKMWQNYTEAEYEEITKKQKQGIIQHIQNLSDEERLKRKQICRKNRLKGTEKFVEKFTNDASFRAEVISKRTDGINNFYDSLTGEDRKEFFVKKTSARRKGSNYKTNIERHKKTQTLEFSEDILKYVIDITKGKTTHQITQHDVAKAINDNEEILNSFLNLNKGKIIRNWSGDKFSHTHCLLLARKFGYKSWKQFRAENNLYNHRLVNIEYFDEPIEVGTLTIDNGEKYHDYHTFALDCGVFTRNSNLGQLEDLSYFVKKLYRALKVPTTRLNPDEGFKDGAEILREELKFARFVIRQQQRFAVGIKRGFITHLKLMDLWDKYNLTESDVDIEFNVPTNFYELRENQRLELKVNNYNNLAANEFVSATYAQKKYLGWRDSDILANREFMRKDAEMQWELAQIANMGPGWKEALINGTVPQEQQGGDMSMGADSGLPGGSPPAAGGIPEFGGEASTAEAGMAGPEVSSAKEPQQNPTPSGPK